MDSIVLLVFYRVVCVVGLVVSIVSQAGAITTVEEMKEGVDQFQKAALDEVYTENSCVSRSCMSAVVREQFECSYTYNAGSSELNTEILEKTLQGVVGLVHSVDTQYPRFKGYFLSQYSDKEVTERILGAIKSFSAAGASMFYLSYLAARHAYAEDAGLF